jgi:hypothetical protein
VGQAHSESSRNQVNSRLAEIVAILQEERPYADAVEQQQAVLAHMQEILKILQTDAERDRLQQRIRELEELLGDTNKVIAAQKDVRADTERGGDLEALEGAEQRVAEQAGELADKIDEQDRRNAAESEQNGSPMEGSGGESEPREDEPGAEDPMSPMPGDPMEPGEPSEGESPAGEPMPGEPMPGESTPGEPMPGEPMEGGSPMPGSPMPGQPMPGQPMPDSPMPGQPMPGSEQQPGEQQESQQTPGREQLEQARREMQQAIDELREQNRDGASDEQDAAIAQLEAMKAKIEEILRQLREEEREIYLTMLEARFQQMLKLQLRINADTARLDAQDAAERGQVHFTKSRDLSQQQQRNVLAAEQALSLLKEEGSSVAFPEAVDQMKSNMQSVADRLGRGDTAATTQLIERMIVESLDEMILSLQKELEKMRDQQQQQQQQQQSGQQDQPLVDQLAELKMIRSLQNQINRLTKQIGLDVAGEQATEAESRALLQDLSNRQERIQEATYDLSTGRNQ